MSRLQAIDLLTLRRRLEAMLQPHGLDGSLYLLALGAVWLACDEDSPDEEATLEILYNEQARIEGVDGDDLLSAIINAGEVTS